mmetsp:Transcript_50070/g.83005  ORF Transcript_50070/g.83005 Transcript_50070/m.83005 type:complete len:84 (-) Transcript_50070:559-810(-)
MAFFACEVCGPSARVHSYSMSASSSNYKSYDASDLKKTLEVKNLPERHSDENHCLKNREVEKPRASAARHFMTSLVLFSHLIL